MEGRLAVATCAEPIVTVPADEADMMVLDEATEEVVMVDATDMRWSICMFASEPTWALVSVCENGWIGSTKRAGEGWR